jgi:hypothetical protein
MPLPFSLWNKKVLIVVVVLLALGAAAWLERTPLLAWYYVRGLAGADEAGRDAWAERVAGLDGAALPGLLKLLGRDDDAVCANARAGLACLVRRWPPDDPRRAELAERLEERFTGFSLPGKQTALDIEGVLVGPDRSAEPPAPAVALAAGRLLAVAARVPDSGVRGQALVLAAALLEHPQPEPVLAPCRELTRVCLSDGAGDNRTRAVHLTLQPALRQAAGLVEQVVPLLADPVAEVRRAAMLAVGPTPEAVATDDLLRWLHDPDADVRRLCEGALRSRGLEEKHLKLGRLITDSRAAVRLEVLHQLRATDLEPGVWLRRLSHDPAPAVRAAAVRAAAEQPLVDLSERLKQMAQGDPSPTVQQLATHYLTRRQATSDGPR